MFVAGLGRLRRRRPGRGGRARCAPARGASPPAPTRLAQPSRHAARPSRALTTDPSARRRAWPARWSAAMRRALALARPRCSARTSPNPPVGGVLLDADGDRRGRGRHQRPGRRRTPRSSRCRRPGSAPAAAPPSSRSSRATTPAAPARAPRPCSTPASPGSSSPAPTRPARRRRGRRAARGRASRSRPACSRTRPPPDRSRPGCTAQRTGRPYVTWKFAATLDGRSRRRRRHQPLDHRRGGRAPTCTGCAPRSTPSSSGSAPCSPTTRSSPSRPTPGHQPLRVVLDTPAAPRRRAGARRRRATSVTRHGAATLAATATWPALLAALDGARRRSASCSRAAPRWPARSSRRAGRPGRRLRRARAARGGPGRARTAGRRDDRRRVPAAARRRRRRVGDDLRVDAPSAAGGG